MALQGLPHTIEVPEGTPPGMAQQIEAIQGNFEALWGDTQEQAARITGLFGDVVAEGSGDVEATIPDKTIDYAKIQDATEATILGRGEGAGSGDVEELTAGSGLEIVGTEVKFVEVAESRLLGRGEGGGAGDIEELTIGTGLDLTGTVLSVDAAAIEPTSYHAPLTDGDEVETELIFADGECVMVEVPL